MSDLLYFCTQMPVALQSLQGQYASWLEGTKTKLRTAKRFPHQQHVFFHVPLKAYDINPSLSAPALGRAKAKVKLQAARKFKREDRREIGEPDWPPFYFAPQTGMLHQIRKYPAMKDVPPGKIPRGWL